MLASYYLTQQEYADYVQSISLIPSVSLRPQLFMRYGRLSEPLRVSIDDLLTDSETTYADTAVTTTLVVLANPNGFSLNDFIMVGEYGNELTEVTRITALSGQNATVALSRAHPTSVKITRLKYDRVEISNSPNLGVTKTVLTTIPLEVDNDTFYNPSTLSGFYYARFYNSFSTNFSDYSYALPYLGYAPNMARAVIDKALMEINKTVNDVLTDEYCFIQLNNCIEEVQRETKRYSFNQKNRVPVKATAGQFSYPLPTNISNNQVLFAEYDSLLIYRTPREMESYLPLRTTLTEPVSIGSSIVKVKDSNDFPRRVDFVPSNPTVSIIGLVGTTQYTYALEVSTKEGWSRKSGTQILNGNASTDYVNYNRITIDETPNALEYRIFRTEGGSGLGLLYQGPYITTFSDTGKSVIAPIESVLPIGSIVINGISIPYIENLNNIFTLQYQSPTSSPVGGDVTITDITGAPELYTVVDSTLVVYPAPDTSRNMYVSYYAEQTHIFKDEETLPFDDTMLASYYLQWKLLTKQNNGIETQDSLAKKKNYENRLYTLRTKDISGQPRIKPRLTSWKN